MLAARDQENLVHGHHAAAASKPLNQGVRTLQPKTPGNKYPKTPLKVPLHDENAPITLGGKFGKKNASGLATGVKKHAAFDGSVLVTPLPEQQTRAPLGAKTTNAKAKAFQTPGEPGLAKQGDKTIQKQTSARRTKKVTHAEGVKLEVHGDDSPLRERDFEVEYCPPRLKDIPYESEDFPDGCLDYSSIRGQNLLRGMPSHHARLDAQGRTRVDRVIEEGIEKSAKDTDDRVLKMIEEDWTVGDVPETFVQARRKGCQPKEPASQTQSSTSTRAPATITSRRAVSALSGMSTSNVRPANAPKPKAKPGLSFLSGSKPPVPAIARSTTSHSVAINTSRSTLGYSKGRSASGALSKTTTVRETAAPVAPSKRVRGVMQRSVSNISTASDSTITPARFQKDESEIQEWKKKLPFLQAFDVEEDDVEPGLRGIMPESLRRMDEDDEDEFVMMLGTGAEL